MAIEVVSTINKSQTVNTVAIAAYARQKRDAVTPELTAASVARTLYMLDLKGDVGARRTEYAYTPATTDVITLPSDAELVALKHAATIAALTIVMPSATALDGQTITISSLSAVTALTFTVGGGYTAVGALTALTAGGFATYAFDKGGKVWRRIA